MYITIYAKVQINNDTHGEVMSNISVKQRCPYSTLFNLYIDELETYLDEISGDSLCLFNLVVAIILYVDDVVLLSRLGASLQRLLTSSMSFALLLALKSIYPRLKS